MAAARLDDQHSRAVSSFCFKSRSASSPTLTSLWPSFHSVSERFQRAIPLTPGSVVTCHPFIRAALTLIPIFFPLRSTSRATKDVVKEMALIYLRKQSACARALLAVDRSESNANAGVPSIKHRSAHIFLIIMQACRVSPSFDLSPTRLRARTSATCATPV